MNAQLKRSLYCSIVSFNLSTVYEDSSLNWSSVKTVFAFAKISMHASLKSMSVFQALHDQSILYTLTVAHFSTFAPTSLFYGEYFPLYFPLLTSISKLRKIFPSLKR